MIKYNDPRPAPALPTLKGMPTGGPPRLPKFGTGAIIAKIERAYPFVARSGKLSVKVEYTIMEIESQSPYTNPDTGISNERKVGDRCVEWFEFGGEFAYGEQEWAALLKCLGATEEDIDEVQTAALGDSNMLMGETLRIRHTLQLSKGSKPFIKPSFESVKKA